jgi:hypothetical protein
MSSLPLLRSFVFTVIAFTALTGCQSTDTGLKEKKHPPLPGEDVSDLSWSRPTGPNDISTPMGLPMSH